MTNLQNRTSLRRVTNWVRSILWLSTMLGSCFIAASSSAEPSSAVDRNTVEAFVARARALKLARTERWRRLLHYRKGTFGGLTSEADGAPFFLAKDGKHDPEAELEATLRALFEKGADEQAGGLQHPFCRFPARRRFLDRALGLGTHLPYHACQRYLAYLTALRPEDVTLIFSSYYLNNPASAFGHTFLRVGKRAQTAGGESSELLDYGVDFSATVDTGNALIYAIKGLTGLFPGEFHKVPYYRKVREYNDYESRDLWEYELDLDADEVGWFVDHLWELGSTYFAYYYLSENCSYHVLGLLEAASPRLRLLDGLNWPVLPQDTIKAIYRNRGLVRKVHYRPSNRTQLHFRLTALSSEERDLLSRLLAEPRAPFPRNLTLERQVKVLDTALDLIDVRLARDLVKSRSELDPEADVQQELLARRAEYEVEGAPMQLHPPFERMPQFGHGSRRLGMGSGVSRESGAYHTLRFRLALHDLADPGRGFPDGASIEFLPTTLRYRVESHLVSLEEIELVRVQSVSPWTRFEHPLSFRVGLGITRLHDRGCADCATGTADVGFGLSLAPFGRALLAYGILEARLLSPVRSGLLDALRVGGGPLAGIRLRFSDDLMLWGSGRFSYLPAQHPSYVWSAEGALRWQYVREFALGVEASLYPKDSSVQGMSYLYF